MPQQGDIMPGTPRSYDVSVGSDITGAKMDLKKAKRREQKKEWYLNNKERILENLKEWYSNNKEKKKENNKEYRLNNKGKIKKYHLNNRPKRNAYLTNKRKTNVAFALTENLRRRLRQALNGTNKSKSTLKLLGCTIEYLIKHLEQQFKPGMNWQERHLFHIDHIRPCSSFNLTIPEQQELCFHYSNLQPLWAQDNMSKGAKW